MQAEPTAPPWRPNCFISYARFDANAVDALVQSMQRLQFPVWIDHNLTAGTSWWRTILQQIRQCDVVIVAVSKAMLASEAAHAEQMYAVTLGKTILPVIIDDSVKPASLPPHLSNIQCVNYADPTPIAGFELATALSAVRPAPPLPSPLPPPPEAPGIYELAERIQQPNLTIDQQLSIVTNLAVLLSRPNDRDVGVELTQRMAQRRDLYQATAQEMAKLDYGSASAGDSPDTPSGPTVPAPSASVPAPGWYADPSGRHQLRWFEQDWTPHASDFGLVCEDPDF